MFASRNLTEHLLRGAAGVGLTVLAVDQAGTRPILALGAILAALVAFRGCPICWTVGLIETLHARITRGRAQAEAPTRR